MKAAAVKKRSRQSRTSQNRSRQAGKLKIGDSWNAISIIALSQNNPLKAIAEFVENSIDAGAANITIVRGKEKGQLYLKVIDDGGGIPLSDDGLPDYKYVATHICDSAKKKLKAQGVEGIQGEFGIGLLSFWTVGEQLVLACGGADGKTYQMEMKKNEPGYRVVQRRALFSHPGTELVVFPLLPGLRQLSGEKIQNYLASELRDRIKRSNVRIRIKDRFSRKEFDVKPRAFTGRLLHEFDVVPTDEGEIYLELYLNTESPDNIVSLFRSGTRVMPAVGRLDFFDAEPWTSGLVQGMIDAPFLQLTPGTRDGVVQDERYLLFCQALEPIGRELMRIVENEKKAEEEEASRKIIRSIQRAIKEALLSLPKEEYDWFDVYSDVRRRGDARAEEPIPERSADDQHVDELGVVESNEELTLTSEPQFFEYPGPLYKAIITPSSCVVQVNGSRNFRCIPRDRKKRMVELNVDVSWEIREGEGTLSDTQTEIVTFTAPGEPGTSILKATVVQDGISCEAESIVTIAETLMDRPYHQERERNKGLPGYTFRRAPGELWRSRFDEKNNLVVINNGHRDYLFAARGKARKLKYICRLYAKELVLRNFMGFPSDDLLERMIELILYTEEHLKS